MRRVLGAGLVVLVPALIAALQDVATAASATPPSPTVVISEGGVVLRVGTLRPGGGYEIGSLELEDYVARVLAGEAAAHSPPAALDALAITARTFAIVNRGRHGREGFDLCTLTHCQVLREPGQAARAAANRTAGQILAWHDAPAAVFYTASCGGVTEKPSNVWPGAEDPPYLKARADRACRGEPHWTAQIPAPDLDRALHASGYRGGPLRDITRAGRTSSGRVATVRVVGLVPEELTAQDFRTVVGRVLGWHLIKSTDFSVRRTGAGFYFEGHGFGHGVGLCVLGSVNRAEHGDSAKSILSAYFPGLKIRPIGSVTLPVLRTPATPAPSLASGEASDVPPESVAPPITTPPVVPAPPRPPPRAGPGSPASSFQLALPPSAEPDRAALAAVIQHALSDIARASGRVAPEGLRIVFHPSAASFGRETGESWWSAARTRGMRVDLQPPAVLRDRGTLETTLRHEIAHLITGPALEGRAAWVKEGAAMHFAGEPPPASLVGSDAIVRRVKCPSDFDLERPASAALARQAYGLAAACFERALAETGDWTAVK